MMLCLLNRPSDFSLILNLFSIKSLRQSFYHTALFWMQRNQLQVRMHGKVLSKGEMLFLMVLSGGLEMEGPSRFGNTDGCL